MKIIYIILGYIAFTYLFNIVLSILLIRDYIKYPERYNFNESIFKILFILFITFSPITLPVAIIVFIWNTALLVKIRGLL